jgi:hypothetical protein
VATEANRTEQLTKNFNTKIATLEAQMVRDKEATIKALEANLATEIQDFESQLRKKENLLAGLVEPTNQRERFVSFPRNAISRDRNKMPMAPPIIQKMGITFPSCSL